MRDINRAIRNRNLLPLACVPVLTAAEVAAIREIVLDLEAAYEALDHAVVVAENELHVTDNKKLRDWAVKRILSIRRTKHRAYKLGSLFDRSSGRINGEPGCSGVRG